MSIGSYICLRPTAGSVRAIMEVIQLSGVRNCIPRNELHMTLVYSKVDDKSGNIEVDKSSSYVLEYTGIQVLGSAIALMFKPTKALEDRFKELQSVNGLEHAHDSLLPHISLKYDPEDGDLIKFKSAIDTRKDLVGSFLTNVEVFDENSLPTK